MTARTAKAVVCFGIALTAAWSALLIAGAAYGIWDLVT